MPTRPLLELLDQRFREALRHAGGVVRRTAERFREVGVRVSVGGRARPVLLGRLLDCEVDLDLHIVEAQQLQMVA